MTKEKSTNWFVRHKILSLIIGLFIIGVIVSGGDSKPNTGSNSTPNSLSSKESNTAKIGQAAKDGKFEFSVISLKCGKSSIGSNSYMSKTAQGQYCLLNLSVKNIGDESQSLLSSNQYLLNASGQKYSADDTATLYNTSNSISWYDDINPGNSVKGAIVFDIPKDQTPSTAELHDSAFSGGVKVILK